MATSNMITVEDTVTAVLLANLDENQSFVDADLGVTASGILFKRGEQYGITKTPAIMVTCGDNPWRTTGNPSAMGGSIDRGVAKVIGLIQFADRDDQEEKIRYFAWAIKEVLEAEGVELTDVTTGNSIYGEVGNVIVENVLAVDIVEREHRMFRSFTVTYNFTLPHNA